MAVVGVLSMYEDLYNNIVISKFERYFLDPDTSKGALKIGDKGKAVENIWHALILLDYISMPKQSVYTNELAEAVKSFQKANHGRADGEVGERTRKLLANELRRQGLSIFARLNPIRSKDRPGVFISYSHKDTQSAKELEDWLITNKVNVIRDEKDFAGGERIAGAAYNSIVTADRVVVLWSENSNNSKWVLEEIMLARELEKKTKLSILIFVKLDNEALLPTETGKIFLNVQDLGIDKVGASIIKALDHNKIWADAI